MEEHNTSVVLPFGPPPILQDIKEELKGYIECPERLPIHQIENVQIYWPREPDVLSLLEFDLAPTGTTLKFDRDPMTGSLGKMQEVALQGAGETVRNSVSMTRAPGPPTEGVRGNANNILFLPGGFEEPKPMVTNVTNDIDFENNLRTLAKGFKSGIEFKSDNCTPIGAADPAPKLLEIEKINGKSESVNLMDMVHAEESSLGLWSMPSNETKLNADNSIPDVKVDLSSLNNITDSTVGFDIPVLNISQPSKAQQKEWAEEIDVSVPVTDFEKKIPDPAFKFDYELDTFQKQAIIKLEEGCNVFVAAHTSAGKTTVAEYAIALTQKHMTRAIYTSPIKALSNQKYRDFKDKFESVGLITGDLQINQTASCLIMTTEILQSMLYHSSEVLRDLEYVIFDEVHYINNQDRGHVWEEVIILLPATVNIVMLSATVAKPLTFAQWVGRIKERKMYVITTLKRPVPLQHYLYYGNDEKTKDNRVLVLDSDGPFLLDNWYKAKTETDAQNAAKDKLKKGPRVNPNSPLNLKNDKKLLTVFIKHLKDKQELPVVIFILSRNRCDKYAEMLRSISYLTDQSERLKINAYFCKCVKTLSPSDQKLPQVLNLQQLLKSGIGVHHSGILPILKEIVELLFQMGLVKLLFATETFAMGVNMPARTVVFDSIRKFDGNEFRTLSATEYIQMAGRAGRRGKDKTGNVIILCKPDVPDFRNLKTMMCEVPQPLQSRFKITYSMILSLRRVSESVTVEGMMRRSFKETAVKREQKYKDELSKIESELADFPPLTDSQKELTEFYEVATDYVTEWKTLRPHVIQCKQGAKYMTAGRILLISYKKHFRKLALLLTITPKDYDIEYKVLVLKDTSEAPSKNNESQKGGDVGVTWDEFIALTKTEVFVPDEAPLHEVLSITAADILEITQSTISIDCRMILNDWEKRQLPRFKDDPPGPTCQTAIQNLLMFSLKIRDQSNSTSFVKLNISHPDLLDRCKYAERLKKRLSTMKCIKAANFEIDFQEVFKRKQLEKLMNDIRFRLSDESLFHYSDYMNRVQILKDLKYIDEDDRVSLKGRVALEMGTHELLITELVLRAELITLQPAEIAALLSALIFQQRINVSLTELTPTLKEGCKIMEDIQKELETVERRNNVEPIEALNFGLVEVIYHWARGVEFAQIRKKTTVQEGIIVRCIQQLNETLRDVKNAAIIIGESILKEKMEEASTAIKRDIVFAASLYTQD
ncbi:helicase SKI2W [Orussus abietinus]|uniref:helicase SKI2W n=1 Tax=Orussus abietinus TaxID=222816 RepID=UPI0006250F63|nr:helicase SKI2W [Orussus abietinus]XP_023288129.1 helicase SKI2W [Orussus abietinus]